MNFQQLNCLVACEQSQEVTEQLIMLGHNAMSCDIEYNGAKGLPHYKGDVRDLLQERYDLVIFHPVCKYQTNSGVRWLHTDESRWVKLKQGIYFFNLRHRFNSHYVGTENPIPHKYAVNGFSHNGVQSFGIGEYDQLFQPWHITNMSDIAKLLEVLRIVDELDTYIKVLYADNKINTQDANELLNYCKKANNVL